MDFAVTGTSFAKQKELHVFKGLGGNTSSLASKRPLSKAKAPHSGIFKAVRHVEPTLFGKYYDRGDIPVKVSFYGASRKVDWLVENIELLDYHHYLPLFFQGLRQTREPYQFLADRGLDDLLAHGQKRILSVLPQLILPIKKGLNTKNADVICRILKKLQMLVQSGDFIAESLVPYYRQILPVFNLLKNKRLNTGDKIDYGQRKERDIGEMIQDTLELFEKHGGEDAYINIKYMIPTYESCMF